jgi:two-component system response regulator AlgR
LQVPIDAVLWLKAEQKYVSLRTVSHTYLMEESLQLLEQEFSLHFVRIHRNALVARQAIIGFERSAYKAATSDGLFSQTWQVILRGIDERLPISRRLWPKIKTLMDPLEHWR